MDNPLDRPEDGPPQAVQLCCDPFQCGLSVVFIHSVHSAPTHTKSSGISTARFFVVVVFPLQFRWHLKFIQRTINLPCVKEERVVFVVVADFAFNTFWYGNINLSMSAGIVFSCKDAMQHFSKCSLFIWYLLTKIATIWKRDHENVGLVSNITNLNVKEERIEVCRLACKPVPTHQRVAVSANVLKGLS